MGIIMKDGYQYGVGGIEQADDISYDNTQSGLTATNVQEAVDELNAGLMMFPNYSDVIVNRQQINSGTTIYTATQPCLACLTCIWASNKRQYYRLLVNGNQFGEVSPRSGSDAEAQTIPIMLNSGDVITTSDAMSNGNWWILLNVFGLHSIN